MDRSAAVSAGVALKRYRDVAASTQVLAASQTELTAILYQELTDTLARGRRQDRTLDAAARALELLAELDAPLGDAASDFGAAMRTIHARAEAQILRALRENDPKWCQAAAATIAPIAEAWASVRSRS